MTRPFSGDMASSSITFQANDANGGPLKPQTSGSESTQRDDGQANSSKKAHDDRDLQKVSWLNFWRKFREGQKRYVCAASILVLVI
jgi:hypothetical protein